MKVNLLSSFPVSRLCALSFLVMAVAAGGALFAERNSPKARRSADADLPGAGHLPGSIEEARGRARWMHEALHGALQVMHRDFFEEDDPQNSLPSQSLDDVFAELERSHSVKVRWLGVNANKGKDHLPKDRFEEAAAAALAAGAPEYEAYDGRCYRYVGRVRIQNECLKCHLPDRTTLEDRVGGLAFSFPVAGPDGGRGGAPKTERP